MKKNFFFLFMLLCLVPILTGFEVEVELSPTTQLDNEKRFETTLSPLEKQPKVRLFSSEKNRFLLMEMDHPIYSLQGEYYMHMEDVAKFSKNIFISYDEEKENIVFHLLKRVYLSIDKPFYLEQNQLQSLKYPPTKVEGEVYLPIKFTLKKLGSTSLYNKNRDEILIMPPQESAFEIISQSRIISRSQDDLGQIQILKILEGKRNGLIVVGQQKLGKGKQVLKINSHLSPESSSKTFEEENRQIYDNQSQILYEIGETIQKIDINRGTIEEISIPRALEDMQIFGIEGDFLYAWDGEMVYRYNGNRKYLGRILALEHVRELSYHDGHIIYKKGSNLYAYDLKEKYTKIIAVRGNPNPYVIRGFHRHLLFYEDTGRGLLNAYNLQEKKIVYAIPLTGKIPYTLNFSNDKYITLFYDKKIEVYNMDTGKKRSLDLINLSEEMITPNLTWHVDEGVIIGFSYRNAANKIKDPTWIEIE